MEHPFDIEQDNNPSLYGRSFNYFNNSLSISSQLNSLLLSENLVIRIETTEKLINSSIIVYLIEIYNSDDPDKKIVVKRRYSEFRSFRDYLLKLYPTIIFPPIPEKHSIFSYVWNSINNNNEYELIEFRKRYFNNFLNDLCKLKSLINSSNQFISKFFDPNYELCWNNALLEPPISNLPKNLLLSNPVNTIDQNGLYLLLPKLTQFLNSNFLELYKLNLDGLNQMNNNLLKLNNQCNFHKFPHNKFQTIPSDLINFETYILNNVQILSQLNKHNITNIKSFKQLLAILINLGGNLNNFSLEIYELNLNLSTFIEKFGSVIDLNYLNYEKFLFEMFIPTWYELINQLLQYFNSALNLIAFYKFKIFQFLILFKTKFKLVKQILNIMNSNVNLSHLSDLNSPSINNLIKNSKLKTKSSWYKVFGGNNRTYNHGDNVSINESISETINQTFDESFDNTSILDQSSTVINDSTKSVSTESNGTHFQINDPETQFKFQLIQKELIKLNQLIELMNSDLDSLTLEILRSLKDFSKLIEKRWCFIFLSFIQSTKSLFMENLNNWQEFKQSFEE